MWPRPAAAGTGGKKSWPGERFPAILVPRVFQEKCPQSPRDFDLCYGDFSARDPSQPQKGAAHACTFWQRLRSITRGVTRTGTTPVPAAKPRRPAGPSWRNLAVHRRRPEFAGRIPVAGLPE
jgi:hypothetical protein